MFDLGKQKIEISCTCGRRHNPTLNDVANRRSIRCGCGTTIRLNDSGGGLKKGVSDFNKSMNDLDKAFKRFGK